MAQGNKPDNFQALISALSQYWSEQGCAILQPFDAPMGAGTFHPATFLRAIGPEPWACAYVQACRRPTDGRYGENPNRAQHYYQFQVGIKPSPDDIQQLYLGSLAAMGMDLQVHDVRFVEDNWESPTLGAWGLGWEVWVDGMEVSQFTYFQQVGGLSCQPVMAEITYGLERIAMYLFDAPSMYDLVWTKTRFGTLRYGDLFLQSEKEQSEYNFVAANPERLLENFEFAEQECTRLLQAELLLPAYEMLLQASHTFNVCDAHGAFSVALRQQYLLRVRSLAKLIATAYYAQREALNFPLLNPQVHHAKVG